MEDGTQILEGRFKVLQRLGTGSFGEIYKVQKNDDGMIYAAKIERVVSNTKNAMLFWESKLMHKLKNKT